MPISFRFDGDDVVWTQRLDRPAVYLDTFAIRTIADSDELSARFASSLSRGGGTWLLAAVCMGEFARFSDPRHAERAERLLAMVVPNIYVFVSAPEGERGDGADASVSQRPFPPTDERNMDYFARKWVGTQEFAPTFQGMFQLVHERRAEMAQTLDAIGGKLVAALMHYRQVESYRHKAKAARVDDGRSRQRIISGELLREPVLDTNAAIRANDAIDLMHAVDAVDFADLVVLDKAWERRVDTLRRKIEAAGMDMPIARCFSLRNDGLTKFLEAIERWSSPDAPMSG
jgi:hypothetical protein